MATARLVASTYYLSSSTYLSVSNASNMYTNTDSDTYATVTNSQSGTTSYYLYIRGFDFNSIPDDAIVNSFSIKLKARESGVNTSTSYSPKLCNNTNQITSTCSAITTTTTTYTFSGYSVDFDTIKGYGNNFGIRINCRRASKNTTGYMYVYGAEITVDYVQPDPRTITSTLSGNGTINPSGATTKYDGDEYELTITPTNLSDQVTITNNNTDVTSELEEHYTGGSTANGTFTAESYTTGLSANNANFYTGSSTTGNYFNYAVGHTAESPGSTSSSYNTYVKDNGSNTATGWADYTFDFDGLPDDAEVTAVEVKCYGACENTTYDATHKAEVSLYSGNTLMSTPQNFTSTSNSTITISNPGTWSREDLLDAKLRFTVAYYGGRLFGISWKVTYLHGGTLAYYTYSYTVSGNATIAVTIGSGSQPELFVKKDTVWEHLGTATGTVVGDMPLSTMQFSPNTIVSGDTVRFTLTNGQARYSGSVVWSGDVDTQLVWDGTSGTFDAGDMLIQITSNSYAQTLGLFYRHNGSPASLYGTESIYKAASTAGGWINVAKAYKKVNGSWVEQTDLTTVFTSGTNYVCGD